MNTGFKQAMTLVRLIRFTPFDTSTAMGQSHERYRRVVLTALAAGGAKGIRVLTMLISVPLTVKYLGSERYGLWMTIGSVIAVLGFADLGLGNGVLNAVAEANGKDDRQMAQRYVSSGFFMLSGIAGLLALVSVLTFPFVPWPRVFNVSSPQAVAEAAPAMAVFVGCFLLNLPLGVVQRVQRGYQEDFVNSLWIAIGNLLGLGGILLSMHLRAGLPWLVFSMTGAPVFATIMNSAMLFGLRRPWLRPRWKSVVGEAAQRIIQLGFWFFMLQIAVAIAFSLDNIIVAQMLGPEAVTQYAVPRQLFATIVTITGMLMSPLWPAYGEAIARRDTTWVRKTFHRSLQFSVFVAGPFSLLFLLFGAQLIHWWVGPAITPSFLLLLGLGTWTVLWAIGNALSMFLNGANIIRFQVVCALLMTVGSLVAKILLVRVMGLPGVVWGTILAYTLFVVMPMAVYIPKLLFEMHAQSVAAS